VFRDIRRRKKLLFFPSNKWMEHRFPLEASEVNLCSLFLGQLGDHLAEKSCLLLKNPPKVKSIH
jgi:hypothetical protein